MKPKIIFIINCLTQQRCLKRVQEFIDHGYEVVAYGFDRKGDDIPVSKTFETYSLGEIDSDTSYFSRLSMIWKAINSVIRKHKGEHCLYYVFSLDMALCCCYKLRGNYIYEESDLVHTYAGDNMKASILAKLDKWFIRKSMLTVFTSEGFAEYHFGNERPANIHFIPNRIHANILNFERTPKPALDMKRLRFGFVGIIRSKSVSNFCQVLMEVMPEAEFHLFGLYGNKETEQQFQQFKNCIYHGPYRNPDELNEVYAHIDIVLSTYDLKTSNIRYAEPNKLYEAIFFDTPMIATKGTFIGNKVEKMGMGFAIDATNKAAIRDFLESLTPEMITEKVNTIKSFDKSMTINCNEDFFEKLKRLYEKV